jgi:DNA-binding PadR family transcriptional regulator
MWPFTDLATRREPQEQRIIAALRRDGEMSGYEIGQRAELGPGSLYPALQRMKADGRLESRWGIATAERGWRRPRLYRLA